MAIERLFLSISLPESIRIVLGALATDIPGVRWSPVDQLHLTLRFLGDVETDAREALQVRLRQIRVKPFLLPVEQLGSFPPKGWPRVLWAGVGSGHPLLYQLRQRVDDAVLGAGLDVDLRSFVPHVSLARCAETAGKAAAHWLRLHQSFAGPAFMADAFDLCSSELRPAGARHHLVERYPLSS